MKSVTPSSSISSILSCALAKEPEGIWCIVASLANTRPDCLKERLHSFQFIFNSASRWWCKKHNVSEQMRIFEIELFSSFSSLNGEESDGDIGNLCKLCRCFGPLPAQGRPAHNRYVYSASALCICISICILVCICICVCDCICICIVSQAVQMLEASAV